MGLCSRDGFDVGLAFVKVGFRRNSSEVTFKGGESNKAWTNRPMLGKWTAHSSRNGIPTIDFVLGRRTDRFEETVGR